MANPGLPTNEPTPGGKIPSEVPPTRAPDEMPDIGPSGPRTPYPVNDPGITIPRGRARSPTIFLERRPIRALAFDHQGDGCLR